jgi:hypothetical protein
LNSQEEGKSKESPKRFLYLTSEILWVFFLFSF